MVGFAIEVFIILKLSKSSLIYYLQNCDSNNSGKFKMIVTITSYIVFAVFRNYRCDIVNCNFFSNSQESVYQNEFPENVNLK